MFRFFFKRSVPQPEQARAVETSNPVPESNPGQEKMAALARVETLAGDQEAADFILQCEFAEARLKAAQRVTAPAQLEQLALAMRNTDRRVARLMQQRWDEWRAREASAARGAACLEQAQRLAQEPQLMVNQVADLDRAWSQAGTVDQPLGAQFEQARAILAQRLQAQAALQRLILDGNARLRLLAQQAGATPPQIEADQLAQALAELERDGQAWQTAPEAASLPRQLLAEFERELAAGRQVLATLEQRAVAVAAYEARLSAWEALPPENLKEDELARAWQGLPPLPAPDAAACEARRQVLLERVAAARPRPVRRAAPAPAPAVSGMELEAMLAALEQALADGSLHTALEHDRALRALEGPALRLSPAQAGQLQRLRAELARLQGWARWGGQVSREELLAAALELPAQQLAPAELAKRVGGLRARWKELDGVAGGAGREAWERFDAACSTAYAPAAAWFQQQAEERAASVQRAQALVAQVDDFAARARAEQAEVDWKAVAAYREQARQEWRRLGAIDRKEKKRLDGEFTAALKALEEPLAARQRIEIAYRGQLIAEVEALDPGERQFGPSLQTIQERWRESSRLLPLARRDEQALWQRYRAACDALFAQKKEQAQAADAGRKHSLEQKEAVCAALEAARQDAPQQIAVVLEQARLDWERAGAVPRAAERAIGERYAAAQAALQARQKEASRAEQAHLGASLRAKLALCREMERALLGGEPPGADLEQRWQLLPALEPELERAMGERLAAGLAAAVDPAPYAALLQQNRGVLLQDVLRLEILYGCDSPPELARERLQLQVEGLQSSFRAGAGKQDPRSILVRACGLAAASDEADAARLDAVLRKQAP